MHSAPQGILVEFLIFGLTPVAQDTQASSIGCCISISSSDSDLLSAMGSHLLGFQLDCAITACMRALVCFHPQTLAKRQARSCSCALV